MSYSRIILVDDNFLCNMEVCGTLWDTGHSVEVFYCAADAIKALEAQQPLAALVTDVDLGAGADGYEVARHARTLYPHLPVVYISGGPPARHLKEGVENSAFIAKPFQPWQIVEALKATAHLAAA